MKKLLLATTLLAFASPALADSLIIPTPGGGYIIQPDSGPSTTILPPTGGNLFGPTYTVQQPPTPLLPPPSPPPLLNRGLSR